MAENIRDIIKIPEPDKNYFNTLLNSWTIDLFDQLATSNDIPYRPTDRFKQNEKLQYYTANYALYQTLSQFNLDLGEMKQILDHSKSYFSFESISHADSFTPEHSIEYYLSLYLYKEHFSEYCKLEDQHQGNNFLEAVQSHPMVKSYLDSRTLLAKDYRLFTPLTTDIVNKASQNKKIVSAIQKYYALNNDVQFHTNLITAIQDLETSNPLKAALYYEPMCDTSVVSLKSGAFSYNSKISTENLKQLSEATFATAIENIETNGENTLRVLVDLPNLRS